MRYKIFIAIALVFCIAVIIAAQFSVPVLFGADGYLHIRMAEFIKQQGVKYDFHWARYSVFARNFADKDFLYHILIIPFTFFPNIFFGAKAAACLFAAFLYFVFFGLLKKYANFKLIPLFLLMLLFSGQFLLAVSRTQPMVFIIALTLLYIHFLIEKRLLAVFIVVLVYTLSHVSSPLLIAFAFITEGVRYFNEREFAWKSIWIVLISMALGTLVHPNFPNNVFIFYLNGILVPIFALKWGLELGAEFFPISTRDFFLQYPFILIGLTFLVAQAVSRENKVKVSTKIWLAIAGFHFLFSFFSQRYITHSYPFIIMALAAHTSDWWGSRPRLVFLRQNTKVKVAAVIVISSLFLQTGVSAYKQFKALAISNLWINLHYEAVAKWMRENIPAGEVIFHANWSDGQYFIGLNPRNDYFVTLDPIYMYYWNKDKYNLYRDIAFGRAKDPYTSLKEEFGVRYGYAGKDYFSGLTDRVKQDSRFQVLAENNLGLIFKLR